MKRVSASEDFAGAGGGDRRGLLLCFSHLRWNFVFQRPQHLLSRAARQHRTLYVEEPLVLHDVEPSWRMAQDRGVTIATPLLPAGLSHATRVCLLEGLTARLLQGEQPDVAWFYTPMAMEFARGVRADVTVYDNMDELSLFHGADSRMLLLEGELLARADLVFTGGVSLFESKRHRHANIHPAPSSVDVSHFQRGQHGEVRPEPSDLAAIPHPRVGFFGVIDERMDLELLEELADIRPDLQFVMVGPTAKIDPATLPRRPNLHWLGARSYAELPPYLHNWDCGFMPFALNDSTRFISPTKTPEFLAAGLPVVSTAIRDVEHPYGDLGLVQIASGPADFAVAIDQAMADAGTSKWKHGVDSLLAATSWDRTWAFMQRRIDDLSKAEVALQHA